MSTRETELPGIGTKHSIDLSSGGQLVVVDHRVGHWELARVDADGGTETLLQLQPREAAEVGRILARGDVAQEEARKQLLLREFSLEWVTLTASSSLCGQSLAGSDVRARTGVSVIAILRDGGSILNPAPDSHFAVDDTLVVMGRAEQVERFVETFASNNAPA